MKNFAKTAALVCTTLAMTATGAVADPDCRTRRLAGDWTLTLHGSFPDVNENPVFVDHIYIACDTSITTQGQLTGTCQNMLNASVNEPAINAVSMRIALGRRTCQASGSGSLEDVVANFEGRVLATLGSRVEVIEGTLMADISRAGIFPDVDFVVLNARLIREPWGGSTFALEAPTSE